MELDAAAAPEEEELKTERDDGCARPSLCLAANGFELRVGSRVLGARELVRAYRQRPRPAATTAVALATASTQERGLARLGAQGASGLPAAVVGAQLARQQKVMERTTARLRLLTEMRANGPQFRGFRDA